MRLAQKLLMKPKGGAVITVGTDGGDPVTRYGYEDGSYGSFSGTLLGLTVVGFYYNDGGGVITPTTTLELDGGGYGSGDQISMTVGAITATMDYLSTSGSVDTFQSGGASHESFDLGLNVGNDLDCSAELL